MQPVDDSSARLLCCTQGELDVIVDLVTHIEQQQFVTVAHCHNPEREEGKARWAALALATRQAQLRQAEARLRTGLAALQAQADIDNRFLSDLRQLRDRWKLRRHPGTGGAAGLGWRGQAHVAPLLLLLLWLRMLPGADVARRKCTLKLRCQGLCPPGPAVR